MKVVLRTMAFLLLMLVALLTFSRRETSGAWIAFATERHGFAALYLMTADGSSQHRLTRPEECGINPRWSPDGGRLSFFDPCSGDQRFINMRRGMNALPPLPGQMGDVAWSPDGQRLVVRNAGTDLEVLDIATGERRYLASYYFRPTWSPDGEWIYGHYYRTTTYSLDRVRVETGRVEHLIESENTGTIISWSPDGLQLVVGLTINRNQETLMFLVDHPDGESHALPTDPTIKYYADPLWSPDGEWIYFVGGPSRDQWQLYRIRPNWSDLQPLTETFSTLRGLTWADDNSLLFEANTGINHDIFRFHIDTLSLQRLTHQQDRDFSPQAAPMSSDRWHPFWLIIAAVVMFLTPLVTRLRS